MIVSKKGFAVLSFIFTIIIFFWTKNQPFFWDTVQLGAKHAYWFYDTNFTTFFLPEHIDSGHPPFFGMYLAFMWKIFGKSLIISHLSLFLFQWGILLQLYRTGYYFTKNNSVIALPILAVADPVLMGQFVLISPDIILAFFFLLALNAILYQTKNSAKKEKIILNLAAIGLAMVSMRGMMVVIVLYLFDLWNTIDFSKKTVKFSSFFRKALPYVPAGLFSVIFLFAHYQHSGWVGYHANSPWAESFATNDLFGMLKNGGILAWRMLDFGRFFLWLGIVSGLFIIIKKQKINWVKQKAIQQMGILLMLSMVLLSISFIRYKGLMGHRYLLPIFMVLSILFFVILHEIKNRNLSKRIFLMAILGLFLGNFWIYPEKIAQGWDSTLAHLPYYDLREKMLRHIENEGIKLSSIGTVFPEIGALKYRDLSDKEEGFVKKDFKQNTYIYYSTIMNNFSDKEIGKLHTEWKSSKTFKKAGIEVILYEKR